MLKQQGGRVVLRDTPMEQKDASSQRLATDNSVSIISEY